MPDGLFNGSFAKISAAQLTTPSQPAGHGEHMPTAYRDTTDTAVNTDIRHSEALLKAGALQSEIFNSANFSSIGTDAKGVIVVMALNEHPDTARIPILVVTAKEITSRDRAKLSGHVSTIMEKAEFDGDRFTIEFRRATFGRRLVA